MIVGLDLGPARSGSILFSMTLADIVIKGPRSIWFNPLCIQLNRPSGQLQLIWDGPLYK